MTASHRRCASPKAQIHLVPMSKLQPADLSRSAAGGRPGGLEKPEQHKAFTITLCDVYVRIVCKYGCACSAVSVDSAGLGLGASAASEKVQPTDGANGHVLEASELEAA
eukprot:3024370-Prymnesium_polylepis.1